MNKPKTYLKTFLLCCISLTMTFITSYPVSATPSRQTLNSYGINGIFYYDPGGSANCVSGGYAGTVSGSDNEAKIWNYLVSAGINNLSDNPAAIAGIVGNLNTETGGTYNPFIVSGSGYHGLYQTKNQTMISAINSNGWSSYWGSTSVPEDVNDQAIKVQLDLLVNDQLWNGRFQTYINNISSNIPNSAEGSQTYAELFLVSVERANGGSQSLQSPEANNLANNLRINNGWQGVESRRNNAYNVYNKYASSAPTDVTINTLCSGNTPYTGDGIPEYIQTDPQWKNLPYSSSTIGESGCGPTSFAMMATALLNMQILPSETANYAAALGQYVPGAGSRHTITEVLARRYQLQYAAIDTCDINTINRYLNEGWMIHVVGNGPRPFTSGGHFIGITGIKDGQWFVADSAHGNQYYSPSTVLQGMRCGQSNMSVKAIRK